MKTENYTINLKKAILLLTDYTMTNNAKEKDAFLSLLSNYICELNDPESLVVYYKICDCEEKNLELYIEILQERLYYLEKETMDEE